MENSEFKIKSYAKAELAEMYFPSLQKKQAMQRLRRWIHKCTELLEALLRIGYQENSHAYLAMEVKLIVAYLGEPD